MGLISQLVSVTAGSLIKASQWNNEFLQIINLLNGTSTDKEVKINSAAPGAQPATLVVERGDASTSNKIATFTTGGVIKGAIATTPTDTTDLTTKTYVDGKKTYWVHSVKPTGVPATTDNFNVFIVPAAGFVVTGLRALYHDVQAGSDGICIFELKRFAFGGASSSLGKIALKKDILSADIVVDDSDAGSTSNGGVAVSDTALSDKDFLYLEVASNSDTRMKQVTCEIYGYSTPS